MDGSLGVMVVVAMFVFRFIVPVGVTLALAYGLHRLDVRWHPELYG